MSKEVGRAIVTGFDGSESARHAAFWAADEARRRNVALRLVTAVHMPVAGYPAPVALVTDFTEELQENATTALAALKADVLEATEGIEISTALHVGLANPVLIHESANAVLMALGSRGLGGFSGVLVGSTAVALSAHGHCPVAVIRWPRRSSVSPACCEQT
jgi:nucleotide-binding universal stress UspA family protein